MFPDVVNDGWVKKSPYAELSHTLLLFPCFVVILLSLALVLQAVYMRTKGSEVPFNHAA